MINKKIDSFIRDCRVNPEMQLKLRKISCKDKSGLIKIARQAGYDFTMEEWSEYENSLITKKLELTEDELDMVSGGAFYTGYCPKAFDYFLCFCNTCPYLRCKVKGQKYIFNCDNGHFPSQVLE